MKTKKRICVVTGSRSEYGHLYWILKAIQADPEMELQLVLTGSYLEERFGSSYREVEKDGFEINEKIRIFAEGEEDVKVIAAVQIASGKLDDAYRRLKPDIVFIAGDRFEMLAAAQAAYFAKIPIAHLSGGDTTEGAFDEAIRHSITKMSHLHFVTNSDAAWRVRQLGEDPAFIFNFGSPILDHLERIKLLERPELEAQLNFRLKRKNLLITFYPVTLEPGDSIRQLHELLQALESLGPEVGLIFTYQNADPEGCRFIQDIIKFAVGKSHVKVVASLGTVNYFSLIRAVDAVVGNSSSGIYEVPSFKKPTVNIGDRQKGRMQADSVINCPAESKEIRKAIEEAFRKDCSPTVNPYGDGESAQRIYRKLKETKDLRKKIKKHFYDTRENAERRRTLIIAEAGVNHNGSLETAKDLVRKAAEAGADVVKFQTFIASQVTSRHTEKADYQKRATGESESQLEMIRKLELGDSAFRALAAECRKCRIEFLSTPCDLKSADFLTDELRMNRVKIASCDITHAPLLLKIASKRLPVILSTGMATLREIEEGLGVLAFGYTAPEGANPSRKDFQAAYDSDAGRRCLRDKVTLLHCITEYPAPHHEVNLRAMDTLRETFGLPVGFSDHTQGIAVAIAAAARGAVIIEKHFTLDRSLPGPDHRASLEPAELKDMVRAIREVEAAMGNGIKGIAPCEISNKAIARKSLVASRKIARGEIFTENNVTTKRPGTGISPMKFWDCMGMKASESYEEDDLLRHP